MSWQGCDDFLERVTSRLVPLYEKGDQREGGDIHNMPEDERARLRDASVLIGIVDRHNGDPSVILTERPKTMAKHPGQVAFPGGKVDPVDKGVVAAALREAHEEVGIEPEDVSLLGRSDLYLTRTGFRITPVIGLLPSDFVAQPDPHEVDDVFETPLSFLMNPDNHIKKTAIWRGAPRTYLEMPHNGRYIWGVTAGVIRALYERLYEDGEAQS
ncbi:CoA pyrophosphatase [Ponticaulis sp.]|uniref:CoA pyrophosphatase n=1 Tax=Ponticaulis sp. TaxID=2020902 RepID=UPI000B70FD48|nr:CoA pyrophosphatase [Ponticaulis sp.]MAI89242.1 CoA pyrophosphatase [Ponticaulis sp.]OUY01234.1 MAG: CoA pyrophosphatase [Hyphomonadaceae bacterium TMED5]|tara:strand:+ start:29386 stop:30024 length:639 start_codon:yes stop_codon:yes gene_type:complete